MDRVESTQGTYQEIICQFLEDFAQDDPEAYLIFDSLRDRYLVLHSGWRDERRIYGCAIHLDLIEGKIWIQNNSTEIDVCKELIQRGVAAKDLVLGFRSPVARQKIAALQAGNY